MLPENSYIPYTQTGEPVHAAVVTAVTMDTSDLSTEDIALLKELNQAADAINPIYRDQFCRDTGNIIDVLTSASQYLCKTDQKIIQEYLVILNLQNGPWAFLPRKNHLLTIDKAEIKAAVQKSGKEEQFKKIEHYLFSDTPFPEKAMFYPADFSDSDLDRLGEKGKKVNTTVILENNGNFKVVLNEEKYRAACLEAIFHLKKARDITGNISFRLYLDAKIEELASGSEEARRLADYHWIRHDSPVDIIISTAIEVYLDAWKNLKGAAGAVVMVENSAYSDFLKTLLEAVPELEKNAPWKWRREEIPAESLPKLKYVDITNWTGDYISSPLTVLAQSLPNDEWVGKHIGTVNMVYVNTSRALFETKMKPISEDIFPEPIFRQIGDDLFDGNNLHAALHEIGHTTGSQDPEHQGQPSSFFQSEYSALEESRAELFGLWAAEFLGTKNIISEEQCRTSRYSMVLSLITGLQYEPVQAHNIARNIIFHYLREANAIKLDKVDEKTVFSLNFDKLTTAVSELLKIIGNLKAGGDKKGFTALRERYCYADPLREEIQNRLKVFPSGAGFIFPVSPGEQDYPDFNAQNKFTLSYEWD